MFVCHSNSFHTCFKRNFELNLISIPIEIQVHEKRRTEERNKCKYTILLILLVDQSYLFLMAQHRMVLCCCCKTR